MTSTLQSIEVSPDAASRPARDARPLPDPARRRLDLFFGVVLGGVSLIPVAAYLWVALHRIGYPFELEWLEGGAVGIVQRAASGHSLYVQPSLHYVPWPYPPLYFWLSGAVAHIVGVGFLALRIVSFAASLGILGTIFALVSSGTGDRVAGLCAVGLFAATFRLTGAWLDIGRVDSLFVLLFLLGVLAARRAATWRGGVLVGSLLFLAFFTKQVALVASLPLLGWLAVRRPRVGGSALGTLAALVAVSTWVMSSTSHGWYTYYVFGELTHQPLVPGALGGFWRHDLLDPLGVALLLAAVGVLGRWAGRRSRPFGPGLLGFDLAVVAGLVGASWVGRLHSGGWDDVLIPAAVGVALLVGQGAAALRAAPPRAWRWLTTALIACPLVLQLGQLRYPLSAQLPTAADARTGHRLLAELRQLPGQVVVLDHPWYAALAGKGTWAQEEAVYEVLRSGDERGRRALEADLPRSIGAPEIGAVVLDDHDDERGFAQTLGRDFTERRSPLITGDAFYPVTDQRLRPTVLFVRRTATDSGSQQKELG